jgi:cell division protein FtsL
MSAATRAANLEPELTSDRVIAHWRRRLLVLLCLLLITPLSIFYVNQTSSLAAAGYDVAVLDGEKKLWLLRNEQLRLEVAKLEALDRIDQIASTKLGMGPPRHQVFVNAPASSLPPFSPSPPAATPTPESGILESIQKLTGRP